MVCLLLSASCVGVCSSRTIALACARTLAFVAIVGSARPDFRTISDCRTRHLAAFKEGLVPVVRLAAASGWVPWGHVSTDGTKMQGQASRHKARSYGDMQQEGERLRADIAPLVTPAQQQEASDDAALGRRRGDELPAELQRRADRLARMEAALRRMEAQAKAAAEDERQRRAEAEAERLRPGKPRRGQEPKPVDESPADKAPSNGTDPARRSMPPPNKGWESCGKAPARVEETGQIMVACDVTEASNDTPPAAPMAQATLGTLRPAGLEPARDDPGAVQASVATWARGYDRAAAVSAMETLGFDPSRATGRQRHPEPEAPVLQEPASAQARMTAQVRRPAGQALYARRKVIVEPVCGQSKAARGFRRFLLRGLDHIRGEWRLGCVTHNLRKIGRYGCGVHALSAVWRPVYGREMALGRARWRSGAAPGLAQQSRCQGRSPFWASERHTKAGLKEPLI